MRKITFRVILISLLIITGVFITFFICPNGKGPQLGQAVSADGEIISFTKYGKGDTTLVFVHGWSCDSRYWRKQIPYFSKNYEVVTIDLAGHGHSGMGRTIYTLNAFGEDVKAVVERTDAQKVILIGHSMGGGVIAQAAQKMPNKVIGIIGIDTLQNIEMTMKEEEINQYISAFKNDFKNAVTPFIESMVVPSMNPDLKKWIIQDMTSAPVLIATSAFYEYITTFNNQGMVKIFEQLNIPVRSVNSDLWPTDAEANRKHMTSFDAKIMPGYGHFLMLENPPKFNKLLDEEIKDILKNQSPGK